MDLWSLQLDPLKKALRELNCKIVDEAITTCGTLAIISFVLNDSVSTIITNNYVLFIDEKKSIAFKVFREDFDTIEVN